MFAGSILDLEPDTAYEAQFVLTDPDGVRGESRRTVTVRTRPEPMPYAGGRVFHVYPPRLHRDQDRAVVRRADVRLQLLVRRHRLGDGRPAARQAGRHDPGARRASTSTTATSTPTTPSVNRTVPLDGTYYLTADGTAERPIAIKAAGDGEAIFDGAGNFALFDVRAADYTYFEGLTFRNADDGDPAPARSSSPARRA